MGAAAGRVFLIAGHAKAGTHHSAFVVTTLADSDAAQGGVRHAAVVLRKLEMGGRVPGIVAGAEAKILVHAVGFDDLAGIHLPVRVPGGLEFVEGLDEFGAEHLGKQFGAGLTVAVLAGEGAAVADHEVSRLVHELTETGDAFFGFVIEVDAGVDAGVAEVAVERAVIAESSH